MVLYTVMTMRADFRNKGTSGSCNKSSRVYYSIFSFRSFVISAIFYQQKFVNPPTNNKYFFYIEKTKPSELESPVTFKSAKTGEYLNCDENGKASMKEKMKIDKTDDNADSECFLLTRLENDTVDGRRRKEVWNTVNYKLPM